MTRPLKLLIVEDNPEDAELALVELRRAGFEPDWLRVETESAYLKQLDGGLDLVLSDYRMPAFNGLRALELLKQSGLDVPFILVSGTIGEETAVAAMKMGATDYLLKDRLARLGAAVTHALSERGLRRDRAQAAEALCAANAELGRMQEQVFQAQRMEAIGTLAGGIAHDLNNILAPVLMAPALLREYARSDHERRLLDLIEQAALRGSQVVRQLLTFSRGTGGERVSIELPSLLNEMVAIMRETFPREIVVKYAAPADLHPVLGDPTQLHQVIMNLCVNARDAMPDGGTLSLGARNVELSAADVHAHAPAKPGAHVALSVSDTGEGIAPANIDRIFDPFFTTKALTKGTGLGLSTVLGIIRSHHGFITVTSELGRGTTFAIHLPAAAEAVVVPDPPAADAPPSGHGELILVVDDEEPIRTATRLLLESHGYRVITAGEGAEALASFVENRGDVRLVLTDLMMPVMGGVTLIRALHLLEPGVRVIATSGLTDQNNHAKLADVGVHGLIAKPCDPLDLLVAIRQQLPPANPVVKIPEKSDALELALV
jgi:signal transduction histidine kinase